MISVARTVLTRVVAAPVTDDEVDKTFACNHRFVPMEQAHGYGMCEACGLMMWMQIEMVHCDWRGMELKGSA